MIYYFIQDFNSVIVISISHTFVIYNFLPFDIKINENTDSVIIKKLGKECITNISQLKEIKAKIANSNYSTKNDTIIFNANEVNIIINFITI